jgi:hypothetical protein
MESCRKIGAFLCLSVAAVCFSSGFANAQVVSKGSFNLSNDARWGKQILPKGEYNFIVRENGEMGAIVTLSSATDSSHQIHLMGLQQSADSSLKESDSTVIITHGKAGDTLRGIYLAGSGVEYTFPSSGKGNTALAANSKSGTEITLRIPIRRASK